MCEKIIGSEEIKEWLDNKSDFSLEMKSFAHLVSLNFEAEHGGTYSDPVTYRPRQFDIRCVIRRENRAIKIAAECKALSKQFPLVIQRVPRTERESFHDIFCAYEPHSDSMGISIVFDNSKILRTRFGSPLYPAGAYVGKSSNQIGRKDNGKLYSNDKDIYEKWAQAISSSHDLVTESACEREKLGFKETLTVVLPVLVVSDDCLWCVDYNKIGQRVEEPKKVGEVDFYIAKELWSKEQTCAVYTASHLKFLTYSGYEYFTRKIASNSHFWDEVFPPGEQLSENE